MSVVQHIFSITRALIDIHLARQNSIHCCAVKFGSCRGRANLEEMGMAWKRDMVEVLMGGYQTSSRKGACSCMGACHRSIDVCKGPLPFKFQISVVKDDSLGVLGGGDGQDTLKVKPMGSFQVEKVGVQPEIHL